MIELLIILTVSITLLVEIYLLFEGKWELDLSKSTDLFLLIGFAIHFCFTIASIFITVYKLKN